MGAEESIISDQLPLPATKWTGIIGPAYEICLSSVGDGCHAVPDNPIGGCWETMAHLPFKNFLM